MPAWTRREDALLRKLYRTARVSQIARSIGRTKFAIKNRVHHLNLSRNIFHKPYTAREIRMLRKFFPHMPSAQVAKRIKRTIASVQRMAKKLGMHKSQKYMSKLLDAEGRRLCRTGAEHRFPKGHIPANKGLRRPGYAPGRMRETQFKKGNRPNNYLPIGTVRPNGDGYLRIKIAEESNGKGANDKAWEFVHRRVWEAAHGPIPKGHRIWWKDKNHHNCALENLELISDSDHMARTTIHNLNPELKDTIMLSGRLKRRIRTLEKKHDQKQAVGLA